MPKPQTFHVLRCYQCLVFQVHQAKKSNKFQCKLCGEKQSLKRRYGIGTAKDCRLHVQKLNGLRGELDEFKDALGDISNDDDKLENVEDATNTLNSTSALKKSKWSNFAETEQVNEQDPNETMYLNNTEVVLDIPNKRKKRSFNCPTLKESTESSKYEYNNFGELPNEVINKPVLNKNISNSSTKCKTYLNPNATNPNKVVKIEAETKFSVENSSTRITKENSEKRKPNVVNSDFKRFVAPSSINSKSKWAHFVDDHEEPKTDDENETADEVLQDHSNSQNLFALCDDDDLDDVLDF